MSGLGYSRVEYEKVQAAVLKERDRCVKIIVDNLGRVDCCYGCRGVADDSGIIIKHKKTCVIAKVIDEIQEA